VRVEASQVVVQLQKFAVPFAQRETLSPSNPHVELIPRVPACADMNRMRPLPCKPYNRAEICPVWSDHAHNDGTRHEGVKGGKCSNAIKADGTHLLPKPSKHMTARGTRHAITRTLGADAAAADGCRRPALSTSSQLDVARLLVEGAWRCKRARQSRGHTGSRVGQLPPPRHECGNATKARSTWRAPPEVRQRAHGLAAGTGRAACVCVRARACACVRVRACVHACSRHKPESRANC
jgi:hypothetical protein